MGQVVNSEADLENDAYIICTTELNTAIKFPIKISLPMKLLIRKYDREVRIRNSKDKHQKH